jgi:spore coat protein A
LHNSSIFLGIAERYDIIVDFRNMRVGSSFMLLNNAAIEFPHGPPPTIHTRQILQIRVVPLVEPDNTLNPALYERNCTAGLTLRGPSNPFFNLTVGETLDTIDYRRHIVAIEVNGSLFTDNELSTPSTMSINYDNNKQTNNNNDIMNDKSSNNKNNIEFNLMTVADPNTCPITPVIPARPPRQPYFAPLFGFHLYMLDNRLFHYSPTEKSVVGSTEYWDIINLTDDSHPIHLHLIQFQIINRQLFQHRQYFKDYSDAYPGDIEYIPMYVYIIYICFVLSLYKAS